MKAEAKPNRTQSIVGWILFAVIVLFLVFDMSIHLLAPPEVVSLSAKMGVSHQMLTQIGAIMAVCLALYVVPKTSVLGAMLLTGYLGGAIAVQLTINGSWLFALILGALIWLSVYLRNTDFQSFVKNQLQRKP